MEDTKIQGTEAQEKCAEALLQFNADIDKKDITGQTPLHYACTKGMSTMVIGLITNGSSVAATQIPAQSPADGEGKAGPLDGIKDEVLRAAAEAAAVAAEAEAAAIEAAAAGVGQGGGGGMGGLYHGEDDGFGGFGSSMGNNNAMGDGRRRRGGQQSRGGQRRQRQVLPFSERKVAEAVKVSRNNHWGTKIKEAACMAPPREPFPF